MKKLVVLLLSIISIAAQGAEVFQGDAAAKLLIGNTIEADYRVAGEVGRNVFYEYYTEDGKIYGGERNMEQAGSYTHYIGSWKIDGGKLCTSVYGRPFSCSSYERIDENTFKRSSDKMVFSNVKIHKGKYRPNL
jgi:hypothetical protein